MHCCEDNGWRQNFGWDEEKVIRGVGFGSPSGGKEWGETGQPSPAWFRDFALPNRASEEISFRCARDVR